MILTQLIVQLLNQYFAADADFWGSFQFLLTTTSEVAVTFIAISIAIMAVMNTRAENNAELRKFIKFDFMYCSILSVLMPLLLLMFASPYSGASISLLILFEIIAVTALFVCIWRIINRVYYSGLQIENDLLCNTISSVRKNTRGLPAQVDNIEDVLMRAFPKASHISAYKMMKTDSFDLRGYDSEFMTYLKETSKEIFEQAFPSNTIISLGPLFSKTARDLRENLKPRIQSPLGVYRICANIQAIEEG